MFVSEMEDRPSLSSIVSQMDTSYTTHKSVQCCSLYLFFRVVSACVQQKPLCRTRVLLVLAE